MSGGDAFPMIERCALTQWRGYTPSLRRYMDAEMNSRVRSAAPGRIGEHMGCLYDYVPLWRAQIDGHYVLTVKVEG